MSTRNETVNLRRRIVHEYDKVNHLVEKLKIYNDDMCKKNDLQIRINDLQRVLDEVACDMKQTNENHLKKKESISKMLEHCKMTESALNVNNQRLRDAIDHVNRSIDTLKLSKENLNSNIEQLHKCNECLENELGTDKVRIILTLVIFSI